MRSGLYRSSDNFHWFLYFCEGSMWKLLSRLRSNLKLLNASTKETLSFLNLVHKLKILVLLVWYHMHVNSVNIFTLQVMGHHLPQPGR